MAAVSGKQKKPKHKQSKARPASSSTLAQPVSADASYLTFLSEFSPRGDYYAQLSLAVDKHRLRVYDTSTGQSTSEYTIDNGRVTALKWMEYDPSKALSKDADISPPKKRKKRESDAAAHSASDSQATQVVVLGLSTGSLCVFSPRLGKVSLYLSDPSSVSPIISIAAANSSDLSTLSRFIWTSSEGGTIRAWDLKSNTIAYTHKWDERIDLSAISLRPGTSEITDGEVHLLVGKHSIQLLSIPLDPELPSTSTEHSSPKVLCTFTGHASPITSLIWEASRKAGTQSLSTRFVSSAESDRVAHIWQVPDLLVDTTEGVMIATVPLDANVRHLATSHSSDLPTLITVSSVGTLSLFTMPSDSDSPLKKRSRTKISPLTPIVTVTLPTSKASATSLDVVAASFLPDRGDRICVARLFGGIKPVFDTIRYLDEDGALIPKIQLPRRDDTISLATLTKPDAATTTQRYAEPLTTSVRSGLELATGQVQGPDETVLDGELDANLAELSLGQRLQGIEMQMALDEQVDSRSSDDSEAGDDPASRRRRKKGGDGLTVPAESLTRTLTQALHSSDARLLEMCLAHSDQTLIQNTVQRLPPQLAVPLILACTERLGRGHAGANMKGGGGGASAQRGTAMVKWAKAVLVAHTAHLMTIPDIVTRLAGLHATLTSRLTLQDRLLTLNGRLELVLSQIELRSSRNTGERNKTTQLQNQGVNYSKASKYVEGQSSDEGGEDAAGGAMDVDVESGDESGSVEDVELGGDSNEDSIDEDEDEDDDEDEDEDEDENEDDEDDEDDDETEGGRGSKPLVNGFIDDEAEDWDEDESDEDEEE